MKKDFFAYYSDNLTYIRKIGQEFAREFPKTASHLDLSSIECQDPFVERLLEGTAFLSARIENRLDHGYERFLESILNSVNPNAVAPIPSMCNVQIPEASLPEITGGCLRVSPGCKFTKTKSESTTQICFESFFETEIHALSLKDVKTMEHDISITNLTGEGYRNSISMTLNTEGNATFASINPEYLDIYLNLTDQDASNLCEYFFASLKRVFIKLPDNSYGEIHGVSVELSLLDAKSNVYSANSPAISGINNMNLYMKYPGLVKFLRIRGLKNAFNGITSREISLVFIFDKKQNFGNSDKLHRESLLLNVIPLINLFRKRTQRMFTNHDFEINVNVDSTHQLDYEIYYVIGADFFDNSNQPIFSAYPFFSTGSDQGDGRTYRNFFSVHRRQRQTGSTGYKNRLYKKQETFISFSGQDYVQKMSENLQFVADCLVTNADLPCCLTNHDRLNTASLGDLHEVQIIGQITKPMPPLISSGSSDDFKRLAFIMCNFTSVLASGDDGLLYNLKQLMDAFSMKNAEETARMKSALRKVKINSKVYRFISKGVVFFEKGYLIELTLSHRDLEGIGFFTFSRIIASLIINYRDLNIPVCVDVYSDEKGFVYSCKNLME